jgi:hypothetical protein
MSRHDVRVGRPSFALLVLAPILAVTSTACHKNEMHLVSRIDLKASVEIRAPKANLTGGCKEDFRTRFCVEEYEIIGVVDVSPHEDHKIVISDKIDDTHCTNVLWLRLLRLGDVGPVDDAGTVVQLPAEIQIEQGAGAISTVAFPQATLRIDEAGLRDDHQGPPPKTCAELGRSAR